MYPRLIHIYGPLWIQSYGVMIALGFLTFLLLTLRHPRRKQFINVDHFFNAVFLGLISGIVGGRLLHIISSPQDFADNWLEVFYPWVGGLVVLGSFIGVLITVPLYLRWHKIPILPCLDIASLYAPLMQSIARFGCLLAGCCYGAPALGLWWAVTFTNPDAQAPLNIPLHPTQLYLSLASFIIFCIIHAIAPRLQKKAGTTACLLLILENVSRFSIDFLRADRHPIVGFLCDNAVSISLFQVWSLIGLSLSMLGFAWLWLKNSNILRIW